MNKFLYEEWYDNRKIKDANLLYEKLSGLTNNKKIIFEEETKTSSTQMSSDKSKEAKQLMKLPQAQSALISGTSKVFGIDNGRVEGKELNNALSDFYASFFKDAVASPDIKKPEPSESSIQLGKRMIEAYGKYIKGEAGELGREFGSFSKAKAAVSTIGKDIKRRLSDLFEGIEKEDKKLLKEFLQALGAGIAAFVTGLASVIGSIITSIAGAIKVLGFSGVGVVAFSIFLYKVMSNPRVDSVVDKTLGAAERAAEMAQKGAGAGSALAGTAEVGAQSLEAKTVETLACRTARKYRAGDAVEQDEYLRHGKPGFPGKVFVTQVAEVNPDDKTQWNPGRTFECK